MLIDLNTKNLKLKKGDMLIFDGKTMKPITLDEILNPLKKDIKKLQQQMETQDLKRQQFVKAFKGANK